MERSLQALSECQHTGAHSTGDPLSSFHWRHRAAHAALCHLHEFLFNFQPANSAQTQIVAERSPTGPALCAYSFFTSSSAPRWIWEAAPEKRVTTLSFHKYFQHFSSCFSQTSLTLLSFTLCSAISYHKSLLTSSVWPPLFPHLLVQRIIAFCFLKWDIQKVTLP